MDAIERLIEAYEEESQTDHCPKVTYFGKGRDGVIAAAKAERDELLLWIGTALNGNADLTAGRTLLEKHLAARSPAARLP